MSKKAKRSEVFQSTIQYLCQRFSELPDCRVGNNSFISMRDVGLSAFSVFFTQCASFLEHQQSMQRRMGKNNAKSLFGIEHVPSDNHIRKLLDPVLHMFFQQFKTLLFYMYFASWDTLMEFMHQGCELGGDTS